MRSEFEIMRQRNPSLVVALQFGIALFSCLVTLAVVSILHLQSGTYIGTVFLISALAFLGILRRLLPQIFRRRK